MRVAVQYALATPTDWQTYAITRDRDWRNVPKKALPGAGVDGLSEQDMGDFGMQWALDPTDPTADDLGWFYEIAVLGTRFSSDHVHIVTSGGGLVVTYWNDDDEWVSLGDRHAQEWTIGMPTLDGGTGRLRQNVTKRQWAEDPTRLTRWAAGDVLAQADWSSFTPPGPANMVMHGVWMNDALRAAHEAAQSDAMGLVPDILVNDPTKTDAERRAALTARWG